MSPANGRSGSDIPAESGVLVLASSQHANHPYAEWLADLDVPLLAIGLRSARPRSEFSNLRLVDTWDDDALVREALSLSESVGFDRVVGLGEVDIVPAGRIREALGLVGQWEESAVVYRDKLAMRRAAAAKGILVPEFTAADTTEDVVRFVESLASPAMVKPRRGLGALGIRRVDDDEEAAAISLPEGPGHYLVEKFIDGPTFHVDSLRIGGKAVVTIPCAYVGAGCISHWNDDAIGSYTLAPENPVTGPLVSAATNLAEAFPGPPDLAIHAEFFVHDGEVLLCEVASRGGGGAIPLLMKRFLGADLRYLWTLMQCGLPVDWEGLDRRIRHNPLTGSLGLPPLNGRLLRLPDTAPDGVLDLELRSRPGEDFAGERYAGRHSGDFVAAWTVTASTETEILRRLADSAADMDQVIAWDLDTHTVVG